jgi:YVTN family beta-propeller protein
LTAASHSLLQKIQLEKGALPMGAVASADGKEIFITTGRANTVALIAATTNTLISSIPVGGRPWGVALSPDGSKLYTANGASNDVTVIEVSSRKELRRIKVGDGPWGIAIAPSF